MIGQVGRWEGEVRQVMRSHKESLEIILDLAFSLMAMGSHCQVCDGECHGRLFSRISKPHV